MHVQFNVVELISEKNNIHLESFKIKNSLTPFEYEMKNKRCAGMPLDTDFIQTIKISGDYFLFFGG